MHKVKHKLTPIYIQNMFEENGATYQLRNGNDFKTSRFRTVSYGKHSKNIDQCMGPYLWSRLVKINE